MNMQKFLEQDNIFRTLFEAIPITTMVVDEEKYVVKVNDAFMKMLQLGPEEIVGRGGDILGCIHAAGPEGCGYGPICEKCVPGNVAMQAIHGQSITRAKGTLTVFRNGEIHVLYLLITAAPLLIEGKRHAVLIVEDISNVTQLSGMVPICSSCKKIRALDGSWYEIERFIEKHSEAQFTHDCCPECLKTYQAQLRK
jgi:PAS domain-containing protein